jgi:hypothetical protein
MRYHLYPLALALSFSLATAAFAQSGGGGGASGGAGGSSSGATSTGSSGVAAPATPPPSISPRTGDVSGASQIPRARTGSELGAPQPGEGSSPSTTGSIGSGSSTVSPSTVDRQNDRDRALNRSLLQGGGVCTGC